MQIAIQSAESPGPRPATPEGPLDDEAIVRLVLDGDTEAFELIMRRYNQRLFRVVRSIVGNEAEADDVLQEAYLRAFRHLDQFEGRSTFSTWLTRIAVYEAAARRRTQRRLRLVTPGDAEVDPAASPSMARDGAEEASLNELRNVLASAVDALPADLRLVFTLRMVERLSTHQTAECLNLTPSNVKVRLHRSRALLRSWIDQRIGEEARRLYEFAGAYCDHVVRRVLERILQEHPS
jgi:RNA polymerase sigma-70 factor (ECF subfamily)